MRTVGLLFLLLAVLAFTLSACSEERGTPAGENRQGIPAPQAPPPQPDTYPEVWSSNGYDGQTYELKVNCFGEFDALETCFRFALARVVVVNTEGTEFELNKDFNINAFSGEVTRRWILYGPPAQGLPLPGDYRFQYYQGTELVREQTVEYEPEVADYPRNMSWYREGNDPVVKWGPREGVRPGMWYNVLVFPEAEELISLQLDWDVNEARLENVPLEDGDQAELNVAVFFVGG